VIKRVVLVGVGAAAGWLAHSVFSKGRDAAAVKAEETLRNTLNPEYLGRNAGQAAATALASSARSFAAQLREEVPAWKTAQSSLADPTLRGAGTGAPDAGHDTIPGTATETPTDSRKQS
jgi:hypothetical protein